MKKDWFLGYGKQWIDDDDIAAVTDALRSDYLTQGPRIEQFEKDLAEFLEVKYAVAVANGTAALHLAVKALDLPPGSEGITSPITFSASANCFIYNNLVPKFADIEQKSYCMNPDDLAQRITAKTSVVIPVHFAGQPCNMAEINQICKGKKSQNIFIIEDASHALGSCYEYDRRVGNCDHGDMAIFSFHPVKTMTTGEGGAITTNNKELYQKLLMLRTHGITKEPSRFKITENNETGPWYYEMQDLGFNYRLTDIQAALGISQLQKIDGFIRRRREIVSMYNKTFHSVPWLTIPFEYPEFHSVFHLYVLLIDFKALHKTRTEVMKELYQKGIGTQVHYIPVHLQPYYRENFGYKTGDFPVSEHYYSHCLSIPLYPKMTDEDVQRVIKAVFELYPED